MKKIKSNIDYAEMFRTLSADQFLAAIFNSITVGRLASHWNYSYDYVAIKFLKIRNYISDYDLYKYFELNHLMNLVSTRDEYESGVFKLITFLYSDIPSEDFTELTDELIANPQYVYGYEADLDLRPDIVNIARDYFYIGFDINELKNKHGLRTHYLLERFKEIHQLELLPVDISLQSFI